jgi:hypothetical protein
MILPRLFIPTGLWGRNRRSVPKHWHINFRFQWITQKKAYNMKRGDDLLRLSRHQLLKMAVAILTGHAPVQTHLWTMGLFEGDPTCRFCRKEAETVQHIICGCEALACQRYNVFGHPFVEPKDISAASVMNFCLFIRGTGLLNLCWM